MPLSLCPLSPKCRDTSTQFEEATKSREATKVERSPFSSSSFRLFTSVPCGPLFRASPFSSLQSLSVRVCSVSPVSAISFVSCECFANHPYSSEVVGFIERFFSEAQKSRGANKIKRTPFSLSPPFLLQSLFVRFVVRVPFDPCADLVYFCPFSSFHSHFVFEGVSSLCYVLFVVVVPSSSFSSLQSLSVPLRGLRPFPPAESFFGVFAHSRCFRAILGRLGASRSRKSQNANNIEKTNGNE